MSGAKLMQLRPSKAAEDACTYWQRATFYSTIFQLELRRKHRRIRLQHRHYGDMHDSLKLSSSIAIPVTCLRNVLPLPVALASRDDGRESCCGVQGLI